jgi:hypothetical protein
MDKDKDHEMKMEESFDLPINLFQQCFSDVLDNKVQHANPVIFKNSFQPSQIVPPLDQRQRRRSSVFQKVDVSSLTEYPQYEKTP